MHLSYIDTLPWFNICTFDWLIPLLLTSIFFFRVYLTWYTLRHFWRYLHSLFHLLEHFTCHPLSFVLPFFIFFGVASFVVFAMFPLRCFTLNSRPVPKLLYLFLNATAFDLFFVVSMKSLQSLLYCSFWNNWWHSFAFLETFSFFFLLSMISAWRFYDFPHCLLIALKFTTSFFCFEFKPFL